MTARGIAVEFMRVSKKI